jgi:hypothetical protein
MFNTIARRDFVRSVPALGALALTSNLEARQDPVWPPAVVMPPPIDEAYPTYPAALVKDIVGAAHTNLPRVRELVTKYPTLAKAGWDWGFGDWETPLGSASHVGNRPIAEFLLENGAAPTVFSAAMLGQLDAVKALAATIPNMQALRGPHGISLLSHAKAGGPAASAVAAFLESLGRDQPYTNEPVSPDEQKALVGTYAFGHGPRDRFIVDLQKDQLGITRAGATRRNLFNSGGLTFHPPGASSLRITFERVSGPASAITVTDGDVVVRGTRVS